LTAAYVLSLLAESLRAVAFYKDDQRPTYILLLLSAFGVAAALLCFQIDMALLLTLCACVLPHVLVPVVSERWSSRITWRLLLVPMIVLPFLWPADRLPHIREGWWALSRWLQTVPSGHLLLARVSAHFVLAHLTGLLLCLSDCNLILRALLRLLGIQPPTPPATSGAPEEASKPPDAGLYPDAKRIHIILDNLNTHRLKSLTAAYGEADGRRLRRRFVIHHTPKHGSWLNPAEIEVSLWSRECMGRDRIATLCELKYRTRLWNGTDDRARRKINWRFTTADARRVFRYGPGTTPGQKDV
jgi:DDE superfamily endonuclease